MFEILVHLLQVYAFDRIFSDFQINDLISKLEFLVFVEILVFCLMFSRFKINI